MKREREREREKEREREIERGCSKKKYIEIKVM